MSNLTSEVPWLVLRTLLTVLGSARARVTAECEMEYQSHEYFIFYMMKHN